MPSRDSSPAQMAMPSNEVASSMLEDYRESILLYITGKLGSEERALVPDIWQEVALAAHRHDFNASAVTDPLNWLRRVASNKIADHWRTTMRARKADTQWMERQEVDPARSPFDWVLRQSRRETVQGVLARLSDEERQLLKEKYFFGHTVAEMARKEGVGEKIMEHRLSQARNSFREFLSSET